MKSKIILLLAAISLSMYSFSQPPKNQIARHNLPQLVREAFNTKFPENPKASWKNNKPNEFEAELTIENITNWITFDEFGNILFVKKTIPLTELPDSVILAIGKAFLDFNLFNPKKIEHAENGILYETGIKKHHEEYIIVTDTAGNILSKTDKAE